MTPRTLFRPDAFRPTRDDPPRLPWRGRRCHTGTTVDVSEYSPLVSGDTLGEGRGAKQQRGGEKAGESHGNPPWPKITGLDYGMQRRRYWPSSIPGTR